MAHKIIFRHYLDTFYKSRVPVYFYPHILRLKKKGLTVKSVESLCDNKVPRSTLYAWHKGKRIPIEFKSFFKAKKHFTHSDINNLAHLLGSILGDGGIVKTGQVHYCNTEGFLIKQFKENVRKVYKNEKYSKSKYGNAIHLTYSSRIGRTLWCLFGKFSSGKDTKIITEQINVMPLDWKIKVVRALYEDEGSVIWRKHTHYISFKQKSWSITQFVQNVLAECKIKSLLTPDNGMYMLRICSYADMKRFKDTINFSKGYRKRCKLDALLTSIKHPHFDTKQKILDLLKQGPMDYHDLACHFKLHPKTVRGHLHGWAKDSIKDSLIKMGLVNAAKSRGKVTYSLA
ncbi:MAG: ArsR family transcriptional regulator [Nanoarchaeota archaeon]|nr:ArsR family transcriptional regulator [Nanoarchaeota archaeon]